MKVVLQSTWQQCVEHLRDELPSQQFNTWIRPLQAEASEDSLTLFAPNRFVQDWVKDKFYSRICELIFNQSGARVDVNVEVGAGASVSSGRTVTSIHAHSVAHDNGAAASRQLKQTEEVRGRLDVNTVSDNSRFVALDQSGSGAEGPVIAASLSSLSEKSADTPLQKSRVRQSRNMEHIIEGKLRHKGSLNSENTFDNFIEGKSNQLARAAAMQVADNPGGAYNPLFIYGGVGLGKTHLMHAIGNYMLARKPNAKVVYLHSETFVATMVTALQLNAINEFKRYYRSVDALLIDLRRN